MLQEILSGYSKQLSYFFDNLDQKKASEMEQSLMSCKGHIIFVGVGKSGIIAEKVAKTMVATTTRAFAMSAMDALHGDIGIVTEKDIVVFLSKSGSTKELLDLVPFVKQRGALSVAWVCYTGSKIEKQVDKTLVLPIKQEVCPFNLAPTTSSTVQLIFGHSLAVSMMEKKEVELAQYARNHPAGNIGKKINLKVSDVMKEGVDVPRCLIGTRVQEGLFELTSKRAGCVIVENKDGEIEGIFTDGDLRRALQASGSRVLETPIEALMTKRFVFANRAMSALQAMAAMNENGKKVNVLPVLEGKVAVGLIKMHDLVEQGILQ